VHKEKEQVNGMTLNEKEKFEKLVGCAEEYVRNKAEIISLLNHNTDVVTIIYNKYKPKNFIGAQEEERLKMVLERFCIELQNYQAMPMAINYGTFGKGYDNKIFQFIEGIYKKLPSAVEIYNGLYGICGFDEEKELSDTLENKIRSEVKELKNKKVNSAWLRYSIGLKGAIDFLNNGGLNKLQKEFKKDKSLDIDINIFKDIYYMGKALTYDFYKELGRTDLIKPDTHIKAILKEISPNDDGKDYSDKETVVKMLPQKY